MEWLQFEAAILAALLPCAGAIGWARSRRLSHVVLVLQGFLFLEVGAIAYAINPGSAPVMTGLLWFAVGLTFFDIAFTVWMLLAMRRLGTKPITLRELDRINDRSFVTRLLTLIAITALLLNFEPWLGVANVAGNALWACCWIPRRTRAYSLKMSADLSASTTVVFPFVIDPARWSQYRTGDMKVMGWAPPGPFAVGTQVVTQQPVMRGRAFKPFLLESTSVITGLVAGLSFSTAVVGRPDDTAETTMAPLDPGTRLTVEYRSVVRLIHAVLGVMLDLPTLLAARRVTFSRDYARLNEILEAGPAQ